MVPVWRGGGGREGEEGRGEEGKRRQGETEKKRRMGFADPEDGPVVPVRGIVPFD